jgi:hypothetical protein
VDIAKTRFLLSRIEAPDERKWSLMLHFHECGGVETDLAGDDRTSIFISRNMAARVASALQGHRHSLVLKNYVEYRRAICTEGD